MSVATDTLPQPDIHRLTQGHLKTLRWQIAHGKARGDVLYRIDIPLLEQLIDAAERGLEMKADH